MLIVTKIEYPYFGRINFWWAPELYFKVSLFSITIILWRRKTVHFFCYVAMMIITNTYVIFLIFLCYWHSLLRIKHLFLNHFYTKAKRRYLNAPYISISGTFEKYKYNLNNFYNVFYNIEIQYVTTLPKTCYTLKS